MKTRKREALITALAEKLVDHGSWCGETHLQKATFLLQELLEVPTEYEYRLHNYGPFSYDLRSDLTEMRGDELLVLVPQPRPYGPKLLPGKRAEQIKASFPKTLRRYEQQLDWVGDKISAKGVGTLERLTTAYWVTKHDPGASAADRAKQLQEIKPHVPVEAAQEAVETVDGLIADAPVAAA
jgi:hypothetical protein